MRVKDKYFGGQDVAGEVGIEIELEGNHIISAEEFTAFCGYLWQYHNDGSLRGESCEVVLNKPIPREKVNDALCIASQAFTQFGSKLIPSVRTGVHVHINIRLLTQEQTYIFMLMWLLFENAMVRYCGEDRVGNLFCLRSTDAQAYLEALEESIVANDFEILYTDELRYSAMNPKALIEYGSLEFRCLKTPERIVEVEYWVKLLLALKDFSLTVKDPRDLLEAISRQGGDHLAEQVFGDLLPLLTVEDWSTELYEGLRRIQPAVFCKEWNNPALEELVIHTELPNTMEEAKECGFLTPLQIVELEGNNVEQNVVQRAAPKIQWDVQQLGDIINR